MDFDLLVMRGLYELTALFLCLFFYQRFRYRRNKRRGKSRWGFYPSTAALGNALQELQTMAQKLDITHIHYPYRYPQASVDASHDRFVIDHNRCILCTRCVRVCEEIEGAHTWDVMGRGIDCQVITDLNQPWGTSDTCTSCGKCVQVCPTGALFEKGRSVAEMEKRRDFLPYLQLMRGEQR